MTLSLAAKQRSIHNNYSTFLVLFIMLSGHFSFLVYHKYNWAILVLIGIISGLARHYFNLRGRNIHKISILYINNCFNNTCWYYFYVQNLIYKNVRKINC